MNGYYLMHRGWQFHPVFKKQPFTEREAFEWMISECAFQPYTCNIKNKPIELQRGQLSHSIRFMADVWKWKKGNVETFLKKLKKWDIIETDNRTGQNVITVCNYDKYQSVTTKNQTMTPANVWQKKDADKTNNNQVNTLKELNINFKAFDLPDWLPNEVWTSFLEHRGKNYSKRSQIIAIKKLSEWRDKGHDPVQIIETTIMNGWKGLFEPQNSNIQNTKSNYTQRAEEAEKRAFRNLLLEKYD